MTDFSILYVVLISTKRSPVKNFYPVATSGMLAIRANPGGLN
jgi:hypothetical protein